MDLDEDNSSYLSVTAISFLAITTALVALRTYVRARLTSNFQRDDWLMLVSQIVFIISCTFILLGVRTGLGRHNKALSQHDEIQALKWQALATATYVLNMMFIKLSYATFLLRFAVGRRYRWTLQGSMVLVAIWSTALILWDIFQCKPVQAQWDYTIPGEQCVGSDQVVSAAYALSFMAIATDFLYALLPIPMLWNVKMTKQAKATVVVLLGLGIFASVATLIRIRLLADLNQIADILYIGTYPMVWTLIEPGVAIIASSLVTMRPLLRAMGVKGFNSTGEGKTTPYSNRPPTIGGGGIPGTPWRGGNGLGRSDTTWLELQVTPEEGHHGRGTMYASNGSETSLQLPPVAAAKKNLYSRREVHVDEVSLTPRNEGGLWTG